MPILWRYLVRSYLKYFSLILVTFVAVLFIIRSQDIAKFATLGAPLQLVVKFACYQIPNLLPLLIPICALITSYILSQQIAGCELTALRCTGLSIHRIYYPLYLLGALLALLNFLIISEITPRTRINTKEMLTKIVYENPLLLLKKNRLLKIQDSYLDMEMIESGKLANNLVFAFKNPQSNHIHLIVSDKLAMENNFLITKNTAFLSYSPSNAKNFDHLFLENQTHTQTSPKAFWLLTSYQNKKLSISQQVSAELLSSFSVSKSSTYKYLIELIRRFSLSLLVFTFTFMGLIFCLHTSRFKKNTPLVNLFILSFLYFVCFLGARSFTTKPLLSIILFLFPHILIIFATLVKSKQLSKGIYS